jgi:hypothetical protein
MQIMMIYIHVFFICEFLHSGVLPSVNEIKTGSALNGLMRAKRAMKLVINKENIIEFS